MIFFLWTQRCDFACGILCSVFFYFLPHQCNMTISWALVVVGQIMLRLFLFQFNVLTTFRIELQCKFVTLKAENTPSLIVCIYMLLLWKHLKKCMFYLFYTFTSLFSLSHFFYEYVYWEHGKLCVLGARGMMRRLKIPLFALSVYMLSFLWKVAVQNDLLANWLWYYCVWLPKGRVQQL